MTQYICIIIHGFTGNPWEIEPLAHALKQAGYRVITPLLPGHRIDKKRMEKATALNWLQMIEKIVENGINENKRIHIIGFSMGAMIASLIAHRYPISTLVLLSPSVYVGTPFVCKMRIKNLFQAVGKDRPSLASSIRTNLSSMRSTPLYNIIQFQKIVRQAKKIFQYISNPICIVHGQKDEIVDPKSSAWIYRIVPSKEKELHFLPNSRHLICQGPEADTVIYTVIRFLKKHHDS